MANPRGPLDPVPQSALRCYATDITVSLPVMAARDPAARAHLLTACSWLEGSALADFRARSHRREPTHDRGESARAVVAVARFGPRVSPGPRCGRGGAGLLSV